MEFLRFVEALRPRAVMMENVPGLADDERFVFQFGSLAELTRRIE
jgi:site-specific DNA-cytosine methylase